MIKEDSKQLAVKIKLNPDYEQRENLLGTIEHFNGACNFVSLRAFENKTANFIKIHHSSYYEIRKQYNLSSQMAIQVISKVANSYKAAREKKIKLEKPYRFKMHGTISYDTRNLTWKETDKVSLLTLEGGILFLSFWETIKMKN